MAPSGPHHRPPDHRRRRGHGLIGNRRLELPRACRDAAATAPQGRRQPVGRAIHDR
jgi:hypothetical protein